MFTLIRAALAISLTLALAFLFGAPQPAAAASNVDTALLAVGEQRQVIEFNPSAALQKRIFADGFVPNSPEFRVQVDGVWYAAQRAEYLGSDRVRVYYSVVGDWGTVRYVQRGQATGHPAVNLLAAGEQRQVIEFNPSAALQKRIFADGFVPNSPEFRSPVNGVTYVGQRAEHLGSGRVRVYYVSLGDWGNVRYAQRGSVPSQATVTISPTSGPSGTEILIRAQGFPAYAHVSAKLGAEGSEFGPEIAAGRTDAAGTFVARARMTPASGRWAVGVHTVAPGQQTWAVSEPFTITGRPNPRVTLTPNSGPANTRIAVEATGFPANTPVQVLAGPAEGGHADVVARGRTNDGGNFVTPVAAPAIKGSRLAIRVVTTEGASVSASAEFTITGAPSVSITPTRGPSGTTVQVTARDFPARADVTVYIGPQGSEGSLVARGRTDANGIFTTRYQVQGGTGMRWAFSVVTNDGVQAVSDWFAITN